MLMALASSMVLLCLAKTKESTVCVQTSFHFHAFFLSSHFPPLCDHRRCAYSQLIGHQLGFQSNAPALPCDIKGPAESLVEKTHSIVEQIMETKFQEYTPLEALVQGVTTISVRLNNRVK